MKNDRELPELPLLLWRTPPGLELILAQEGIAYERVTETNPFAFLRGRFVLHDGRRGSASSLRSIIGSRHTLIDIDMLRKGRLVDPFAALIDCKGASVRRRIGGVDVTERVSRRSKASIRRGVLEAIREHVKAGEGVWARIAAYPHPFRSAFNFRVDMDEPNPDDYFAFARSRKPIEECTTYFVSTNAYGDQKKTLADLAGRDAQSHGHYHHVYRDEEANRRNLVRAHEILTAAGIGVSAFAAPHGRWNEGLGRVIEDLGYLYSSEFQLGYDDYPFYPYYDGRFSTVLQVPIHPICEGLFFDAGVKSPERIVIDHFRSVLRARIDACEPAFLYGHPERRLARMPELPRALAEALQGESLVWRTTTTEFATWWRKRNALRWSLIRLEAGTYEIRFDTWDSSYPIGLEIVRGEHAARVPIANRRTPLRLDRLAYERRARRSDSPKPVVVRGPIGLKEVVRAALDWETVTPIDEIPARSLTGFVKKNLRKRAQKAKEIKG